MKSVAFLYIRRKQLENEKIVKAKIIKLLGETWENGFFCNLVKISEIGHRKIKNQISSKL